MFQIFLTTLLVAPAILAQNTEITWVRATYLKDKPGAPAADIRATSELASKGAAAYVREGVYDGFVRMRRTFPTVHQTGHDVLYLYFSKTRPNLTQNLRGDVFLKAIGLTAEQWAEKRSATGEAVNMEIWMSIFRHGSTKKGDTVRLGHYRANPGGSAAAHSFLKQWMSPMRAALVQRGVVAGDDMFQVMFEPGHVIGLDTYAKGDGPLYPFPDRQAAFLAAHPGKDYHAYVEAGEKSGMTVRVGQAIYRVEEAIGK